VGWIAALGYNDSSPKGKLRPQIELLEFMLNNPYCSEIIRHYDDVLTRVLENVYKMLPSTRRLATPLGPWGGSAETAQCHAPQGRHRAHRAQTDKCQYKFLSDMFYALGAYRMAAARVGVTDYRNLVETHAQIAGDLYEFMVAAKFREAPVVFF
jgi:hypothetical protein